MPKIWGCLSKHLLLTSFMRVQDQRNSSKLLQKRESSIPALHVPGFGMVSQRRPMFLMSTLQQFHAYTSTNYLWPDFSLTFPEEYIHSDEQHIFSQLRKATEADGITEKMLKSHQYKYCKECHRVVQSVPKVWHFPF